MSAQATAIELGKDRGGSETREDVLWLLLGSAVYFVLGLVGRATIAEGEVLSLVWPAAGAAMLMIGLAAPRRWPVAALLLAVATVVLNLLTGSSGTAAGIFVVANVLQPVAAVLVLRALAPGLRGAGGDRPLDRLWDFWALMFACVVGALLGAVSGSLGRALLVGPWTWLDAVVWWARNAVGSVVVATTGILLIAAWQQRRRAQWAADLPQLVREKVRARGLEVGLLVVFTLALYLVEFLVISSVPVAFPLLVPTVWAGMRFRPLFVTVHSLAVSVLVVAFTLAGVGPFVTPGDWREEVLVSQLFIGIVFCLGTLLALGRRERAELTRTLSAARAASETQAQQLSTIIDSMHDGVSLVNELGQVVKRNPAGAEMVRSAPDALGAVKDSHFRILTTDGRLMEPRDYPWVRALREDNVPAQDIVLEFDDGSPSRILAVSVRRLPTTDEVGLRQAVVIYHDVTVDRAQRSALESFAGVVAHDLLGPLGVIDGWSEMLELDLETNDTLVREQLEPKVDRIRSAVVGMRRLIDGLLESATSRDQQLRSEVVDLEATARAVAEQRSAVTDGTPPRIEVGALPPAYADPVLVRQLVDNLVGNAVKYVRPGEVPHVVVTGRLVGDMVEVTVADEGIGIPAAQRDQVFEAFHRAHGDRDYEGHGIGLSVCKRIVERHGGRIYARAPLGRHGTRIVFSLPAAHPGAH